MSEAAVITRRGPSESADSPPTGCVLIIDDEAEIRESLQTLLELEGYDVESAASVDDAWQRLSSRTCSAAAGTGRATSNSASQKRMTGFYGVDPSKRFRCEGRLGVLGPLLAEELLDLGDEVTGGRQLVLDLRDLG